MDEAYSRSLLMVLPAGVCILYQPLCDEPSMLNIFQSFGSESKYWIDRPDGGMIAGSANVSAVDGRAFLRRLHVYLMCVYCVFGMDVCIQHLWF